MLTRSRTRITPPPSRAWDRTLLSGGVGTSEDEWSTMPHEQGLAISADAAQLQTDIRIFLVCVVGDWRTTGISASQAEERGSQRFRDKLRAALDSEPLEDGMDHPAESVIVTALDSEDPDTVLCWIQSICLDSSNPAFAAAVFVCVARQPGIGTARWREELVCGGLAVDDVEVRDAAMQAAEYWADPGFLHVLSAHSEPVGWLDEFRRGVVDDLGG